MIVYDVITAICFALLTLSVLYVLVNFFSKSRADKISFIRGFKKGKCVAIFLIAIPLLCIGYVYSEMPVLDSILSAISHVIDLVVLKFNVSKVSALVADSVFYRATIYYCCVLVIFNAALFALSFVGQYLWQLWNKIVRSFTKKDKLIVFGNNDNSISIYKSGSNYCACLVDDLSAEQEYELYRKDIRYMSRNISDSKAATKQSNKKKRHSRSSKGDLIKSILKSALTRNYTIVINYENDEKNLQLCNLLLETAKEMDAAQEALFNHLRIYVFGDPKYEALYGDIVQASYGCIRYKNKYQMLAMDFIDKYPITKFMDERHIDYSTTFINPDIEINVCMIGFGKPNRQIFLTSVANNQFLTKTAKGVQLKPVNYHIFDKVKAENNKNLNHLYYRYKNEFQNVDANDYLPLPAMPATETPHHFDISSDEFYKDLRKVVARSKDDVNFVIVSFRNDLENIDMAQKIVEKRREWGADNVIIFVRVQKARNKHFVFREENVYFIGNEDECAYDIERITNDKFFKMAQMRNEIYDLEYKITHIPGFVLNEESFVANKINANKNWYVVKNQLERESSLYGCLSLQSKLNLMGLEYVEDGNPSELTEEGYNKYIQYYAADDIPDVKSYDLEVDGKKVVKYTLDFAESKRKNLAVLEHYRWNSFMLSKGMVPASKDQILSDKVKKDGKDKYTNGKNYRLRRHGNLTTFEGLVTFRQMVAERDGGNEADYDVIKYDYQLLDDAYWLLTKNGYKIVKRQTAKQEEK